MELSALLSHVDHTLLTPTATWAQIKQLCDDGLTYGVASVCIPASHVASAADYLAGRLPVCTVIGFPNGYDTTRGKCFLAHDAAQNGADEIDMVINLGWVKQGSWDALFSEIVQVKQACGRLLKVIVETCQLTQEEKLTLCDLVSASGADYIKTSTGFSTGGATREDIALFKARCAGHLRIKAAGGIATFSDTQDFLALGADRLGTSRIVALAKAAGYAGKP